MSLHIQRFVDRVRAAEARNNKDLVMSMADAKDLHADITRLLITLQILQEAQTRTVAEPQVLEVNVTGGTFR